MRPIPKFNLRLMYLLLLLLSLAATAMPAPPPAISPDKVKDSEIRFLYPAGQIYDYDKVFPLVVEINNRSALPKTYKASWNLQIEIPEPLQNVKLEPGEKRRFSLVFPRNEASRGGSTIDFNKVSYTADLQPNPRQSITGLLSPTADKFDYLRTLKLEADPNAPVDPSAPAGQAKLVPLAALSILDPELVPESWCLLSSLDVLITYDLRSMSLSKAQMEALVSWACEGGNLVLVSDGLPEEFQGTPFEPHLPLTPTGVSTEQGLVQLVGDLTPGAEVLMSYNTRPLLLKKPLMQGNVFLVTAPLKEQAPLTTEDAEALWRQVQPATPDTSSPNYNYGYYSGGGNTITSNTLKDIPELPRASAGWVAMFLLVYALIVGPVNLGILRRKDKMLWSFVTVPSIALVFAGGAYLLNLANRSSVPVLRELGIMQLKSGDTRAVAESEALMFSPSARRYFIDCSPQAICHASTYRYDEAPFGMYNILPDGGLQAKVDMGTWDVFMLGTESLIDLPKPITGSWKDGTLTVDSPYTTDGTEAQVFNVEKGASPAFALKGGPQTERLELKDPASYTKFDALAHPADAKAHPGREALVAQVSQQSSLMFAPGKTYLLFWTNQLKAPLKPQAPAVHKAEYLVIVELDS